MVNNQTILTIKPSKKGNQIIFQDTLKLSDEIFKHTLNYTFINKYYSKKNGHLP